MRKEKVVHVFQLSKQKVPFIVSNWIHLDQLPFLLDFTVFAMSNNNTMENLVLAVDVPENSVSGSTFHVALENRFFEVTVPEGVIPGQTINIIVPQNASVDDASVFQSVEAVREAAISQAKLLDETYKITDKVKQLDETYKVTERAQAISAQAIAKAQEYDAKYDISTKVNSYLSTSINKTKEIDQTYQVKTSTKP